MEVQVQRRRASYLVSIPILFSGDLTCGGMTETWGGLGGTSAQRSTQSSLNSTIKCRARSWDANG